MNPEFFEEEETEYTEYTEFTEDDSNDNDDNDNNITYELEDDEDSKANYLTVDTGSNDAIGTTTTTATTTTEERAVPPQRISATNNDNDRDGFEIKGPLVLWDDDSDCVGNSFYSPPRYSASVGNAHGVVYVRLLRARNLPCPVGSSVGAIVSLLPYKGRVKSIGAKAFSGTIMDHGVCAKWGTEKPPAGDSEDDDDDLDSELIPNEDDEKNLLSMVNAWSGPDSPVPSIKIDLTFSPLGLGVFDFTMASVELSSDVLLQKPRVWRTRWCPMKVNAASLSQANYHHNHNDDPFLRIQALFEPSISPEPRTSAALAATPKRQPPIGTPPPPQELCSLF